MIFFYVSMNRNWQQTSGRLSIITVLKHPHLLAGCRSTDTEEQCADQTPHALQTLCHPVRAAGDASPRAQALKPCMPHGTLLRISTAQKNPKAGSKSNNHVNLSLWVSVIIVCYQSMHALHKLFSLQLCSTFPRPQPHDASTPANCSWNLPLSLITHYFLNLKMTETLMCQGKHRLYVKDCRKVRFKSRILWSCFTSVTIHKIVIKTHFSLFSFRNIINCVIFIRYFIC